MILRFHQISAAVRGAVKTEEDAGWFRFHRFTSEQEELYDRLHNDLAMKTPATTGVRLAFETDSKTLSFCFRFIKCSSRNFPCIDVWSNGAMIAHVGLEEIENRVGRAELALGEDTKLVEIYLSWAMSAELSEIALDDGASFVPKHRKHTLLAFGDSITQGYDCKYPSLTYANTVARLLDADVLNKGIGGEIFFPELSALPDEIDPDYITVAYGTNDWSIGKREKTETGCRAFYQKLSACYPKAKIFALAPIWRSNGQAETGFGVPVTAVCDMIRKQTVDLANVTVICGDSFIPHLKAFTTDGLHPNDAGAQIYAQNLYKALQPYL